MPKTHLARVDKIVQRARQSITKARHRRQEIELTAWGKVGLFAGGVLVPVSENYIPLSFLKVPTKIWLTAIAWGVAVMTKGAVQRTAMQLGDAVFSIYVYKATTRVQGGMPNPLVAGEDIGILDEV